MIYDFGIKDAVDIFLVALLLYYIYRLMRESRSVNVFLGIMIFVVLWIVVSHILEMKLLGAIMDKLVSVGVIGLIILFQQDIRKFLEKLGAHRSFRFISDIFVKDRNERDILKTKKAIMPVVWACQSMSKRKEGALIVIERRDSLRELMKTGERIDAEISSRLIENIFFKNSPLHDGAMIISKRRIHSAGCILPVSHDQDIPKEFGLRHRAALGMSQENDSVVIVVSEETGGISMAIKGELKVRISAEKLESVLTEELCEK